MRKLISCIVLICTMFIMQICSATSMQTILRLDNANPLGNQVIMYNLTQLPNRVHTVPAGVYDVKHLTKGKYNSYFTNVSVFDNGYAMVNYHRGNRTYMTYVSSSLLLKNTNKRVWKTETATQAYTLYADEKLTQKIASIAKGKNYTVIYQNGQLKQVSVSIGNNTYLGWIDTTPPITIESNSISDKVLGPVEPNVKPKQIVYIHVGNPINSKFNIYTSLTSKQIAETVDISEVGSTEGNSEFMDVRIFDNGFTEVSTRRNGKFVLLYLKTTDITASSKINSINMLPEYKLDREYHLYTDSTLKKKIHTMEKGKPYKVLVDKGNLKQIYAYGKGQYTAIGWIKVKDYKKDILGDVNDDKKIDKTDLSLLREYLSTTAVEINTLNADLNNDGTVDSVDYKLLSEMPKFVFDIHLGKPVTNTLTAYADITGKYIKETITVTRFNYIKVYDNGCAEVEYFNKTGDKKAYIKTSTFTTANLSNINSLPEVKARKEYVLYYDKALEDKIYDMPIGKTYKVLLTSGNLKQVYAYGAGDYRAIGWIKEGTDIKGDVDGNGIVNANDLTVLKKYMVNTSISIDKYNADMNGDGKITTTDVGQLQAKVPVKPVAQLVSATIQNGWYEIVPFSDPNAKLRMDVDNGIDANGTNIQLCNTNNENPQRFYLENTSDGYFTLKTGCSNDKYVTTEECSNAEGTNIIQYKYEAFNGRMQQKFRLLRMSNERGTYFIEPKIGNGAVIGYNNLAQYGNVVVVQRKDSAKYKWQFKEVDAPSPKVIVKTIPNGWYRITPMHATYQCLDVSEGKDANEVNIQLWGYTGANAQKFYVQNVGNNYFTLKTGCSTNRYVDVKWGGTIAGTNLWQYEKEPSNNTAQKFRLLDAGNGAYYIEPKLKAGLVFDCQGGRADNGTNVQLWTRGNVNWHKWKFEKVAEPETYKSWTAVAARKIAVFTNSQLTTKNANEWIDKGDHITILNETSNAYFAKYPIANGKFKERWVSKDVLKAVSKPDNTYKSWTAVAARKIAVFTNSQLTTKNANEWIDKGDHITILNETSNTYFAKYPIANGKFKERWVSKDVLKAQTPYIIDSYESWPAQAMRSVGVYSNGQLSGGITTIIKEGAAITIFNETDTAYNVRYQHSNGNLNEGWVTKDILKKIPAEELKEYINKNGYFQESQGHYYLVGTLDRNKKDYSVPGDWIITDNVSIPDGTTVNVKGSLKINAPLSMGKNSMINVGKDLIVDSANKSHLYQGTISVDGNMDIKKRLECTGTNIIKINKTGKKHSIKIKNGNKLNHLYIYEDYKNIVLSNKFNSELGYVKGSLRFYEDRLSNSEKEYLKFTYDNSLFSNIEIGEGLTSQSIKYLTNDRKDNAKKIIQAYLLAEFINQKKYKIKNDSKTIEVSLGVNKLVMNERIGGDIYKGSVDINFVEMLGINIGAANIAGNITINNNSYVVSGTVTSKETSNIDAKIKNVLKKEIAAQSESVIEAVLKDFFNLKGKQLSKMFDYVTPIKDNLNTKLQYIELNNAIKELFDILRKN